MKKILCMLTLACLLAASLIGCDSDPTVATETESESVASTVTYTFSVKSEGGSSLGRLNYLVHKNGVPISHGTTDQNGLSSISVPTGASYAIEIISPLPDGYHMEKVYPLTDTETTIRIPSAVIEDTDLNGVSYRLGHVMRDFTVTDIDGKSHTLSDILKEKKAVMLNFWYVGCDPCKAEFPHMQTAYVAQNSVEILAMNDTRETAAVIKDYRDTAGLTFPVIKEENGLAEAMRVGAYPTTIIIDRYGVICLIHEGGMSEEEFSKVFAYFSTDDYTQVLFDNVEQIPQ